MGKSRIRLRGRGLAPACLTRGLRTGRWVHMADAGPIHLQTRSGPTRCTRLVQVRDCTHVRSMLCVCPILGRRNPHGYEYRIGDRVCMVRFTFAF